MRVSSGTATVFGYHLDISKPKLNNSFHEKKYWLGEHVLCSFVFTPRSQKALAELRYN